MFIKFYIQVGPTSLVHSSSAPVDGSDFSAATNTKAYSHN